MGLFLGNNMSDEEIEKIKKVYAGKISEPIIATIIGIPPYLNLVINILNGSFENLLLIVLFSGFGMIFSTIMWTRFIFHNMEYRNQKEKYLSNPDSYEW